MTAADPPPPTRRWQRFSAASLRGFHGYANWLVGISWKRFFVLSVLLMLLSGLLQNIPPFSWSYTRTIDFPGKTGRAKPPAPPGKAAGVSIVIDEQGVRITPQPPAADAAASGASAPPAAASGGVTAPRIDIRLPPGASSKKVREAVEEARQAIEEAVAEAHEAKEEARHAAARQREVHRISLGEFLPTLAMLWIVASIIIKITYKRQIQAEAQAAQAVETAESESLKRQVVEARMAAMQAQVEPHFLFNTLASIDHLIEVDPRRASRMQKHLIALLRASMPALRETPDAASRDLGRELAMVRPYLEILKVRMEERLATEIDVPEGLLSAEFPPMMLQTLVENAIKHGLEPKPEGGRLRVKAEIVHGKLAVSVADSGLGFRQSATTGTGIGLANIRERLQLLYGSKASLTISENPGGGTRAVLALPYKPVEGGAA